MEIKVTLILGLAVLLTGCSQEDTSDAYGQFEADEIIIYSETTGKLLEFNITEGEQISENVRVAVVDTTTLVLRKKELLASIKSVRNKLSTLKAQADVYKSQLETAQNDMQRLKALQSEQAATQKQIDDAVGAINTIRKQITAVEVQRQSVYSEIETIETKIAQINDQINRSIIINPINGRVLTKFAEQFELTSAGKPLYEIANTNQLTLRIFVSGSQLPKVILGEEVEVLFDADANSNQRTTGKVTWISSKAEFTPKMIQTKEERVTQVYAVKILVNNAQGLLKIGMPGEVNFN
tara:strand:- start:3970 stop:4854 length:885 start_codon:yes stop_codon:yes gene_type:complete